MSKKKILSASLVLLLLALLTFLIPRVRLAVAWRVEKAVLYINNVIDPPEMVPTALPFTPQPSATVWATATAPTVIAPSQTPVSELEIATPVPTIEPLPAQVSLPSPRYEQQTPNNCGPATLSMALHLYGWEGDQTDISDAVKPVIADRNVNPEELAYYVRNFAGWLNIGYRVGGDLLTLKILLAAGYPVIVESVTSLDPNDALGPSDDLWAAHYLLLTGYDDTSQTFTIQDSYHGKDLTISYAQLEEEWKPFNNLYMVIYFPDSETELASLLGSAWDVDANREENLAKNRAQTELNPDDVFAWFNLGSDLVYFEQYQEASLAYDKARNLETLPMRMFRYQFGPFWAYFHSDRIEDLQVMTEYALSITNMSEETWFWHGWALYRQQDYTGAKSAWEKALKINPSPYADAYDALQYVQ
jgi:hypothetical protein